MAGKRTMLTESLLTALTQAFDEVSRRVEQVTAGEGLSLEQWLVLRQLAEHGRQAIRELVAGSRIDDSSLTRIVDRLAEAGAVHRDADPTDRRRVLVSFTARGRAVHDRLARRIEQVECRLLDALDDSDPATLIASLAQLGSRDTAS